MISVTIITTFLFSKLPSIYPTHVLWTLFYLFSGTFKILDRLDHEINLLGLGQKNLKTVNILIFMLTQCQYGYFFYLDLSLNSDRQTYKNLQNSYL